MQTNIETIGNMEKLIDAVVEQITIDVRGGDYTAIEELVWYLPKDKLIKFLPEEKWDQY